METEQPSVKTEGQIFRIDTTRADEIEQIAKEVTTMFTSWDDLSKNACMFTSSLGQIQQRHKI